MKRFMVIVDRLKEPSTWASLAPAALVVGVAKPEFLVYSAAAVGVFVFLGVILKEKGEKK